MSQYVIAVYDFGALTNSGAFLPAKQRYHSNSMVQIFSTYPFASENRKSVKIAKLYF
jgi:hypothetical protein